MLIPGGRKGGNPHTGGNGCPAGVISSASRVSNLITALSRGRIIANPGVRGARGRRGPAANQPPTHSFPAASRTPDGFDVLILDAGTRQSLASVRSLGRAGLRVAAGGVLRRVRSGAARARLPVPVLRRAAWCCPASPPTPRGFAAAIIDFVRAHPTRVVMPASDGAIAALDALAGKACRARLPAGAGPGRRARGGQQQGQDPRGRPRPGHPAAPLGPGGPASPSCPRRWPSSGFPCVLKPTARLAGRGAGPAPGRRGDRARPRRIRRHREVPGRRRPGAGPGMARRPPRGRHAASWSDDDVRASFAHPRAPHHARPWAALGLRESIPMPDDISDAAVRLVKALGLQGLCEVEFRRDAASQPLLMEINARLAGRVETALVSGVDFPLMVWQWATGQPVEQVDELPDRGPDALAARRHALAPGQPPPRRAAGQPVPRPGAVDVRRGVRPRSPATTAATGATCARSWPRSARPRRPSATASANPPPPETGSLPEGSNPCQLTRS